MSNLNTKRAIRRLHKRAVFRKTQPSPLPPLPIQYADYAVWQRDWLRGERLQQQIDYWKHRLAEAPVLLQLPTDFPRPAVATYAGAKVHREVPTSLLERLRDLARAQGVTLFMTLLAAFNVLLARYSGQEDIVVGSPIANRNRKELEGLIGFFLNLLALRTDLSADPSFLTLLHRVREGALGAYAHQDLPLEKLLEALQPERSLSHTPLFQVTFNLLSAAETSAAATMEYTSLKGAAHPDRASAPEALNANFDLTLYARDHANGLSLTLVYNVALFEAGTARQMLGHFVTLLENIVANPAQRLSELSLLTQVETERLAGLGNRMGPSNAFEPFSAEEIEQSIPQRFAQQVRKYPHHLAVQTRRFEWTYERLERESNRVAHTLLARCAHEPQRIGLLFEQEAPLLASVLGVLKCGHAYVPLDPVYPRERLAYFLRDSGATALLTDGANLALAEELAARYGAQVLCVEEPPLETAEVAPVEAGVSAESLAYILYTSGTTGEPKGVMQNHRNVLHFMRCYTNNLHIASSDRLSLFSSYGFDAAVMDIFGALLNGATLCVCNTREESVLGLEVWLREQQITVYHSTPTLYRYFTSRLSGGDDFPHVRLIVLGGEAAFQRDVEAFRKHFSAGCVLVNGLGPTESSVTLQYFLDRHTQLKTNAVPVGYAVEETEVVLVSPSGHIVSGIGSGEMGIRSAHVALGYWQKPEQTQQAFLPTESENVRIYRTGDRGRRRADGSLEYLGRLDHQVKIRGFRIELSEIEAQLCRYPGVRAGVVVAREDVPGEQQLVAYVVSDGAPSVSELREYLLHTLPEYMVPSAFVTLEAMPLTPNGKLNRRALPAPQVGRPEGEIGYSEARTAVETLLTGIWSEVLGVEQVGVHDNFFELGGHSLLAVRLFTQIQHHLGTKLPLAALFRAPTIAQLAPLLQDEATQALWSSLVAIQPHGDKPPFFCVHAIGANLLNYRLLARHLGQDQPLYGFQARGLDGEQTAYTSVEAMAAHYIAQMRRVQASGPYRLGGGSAGGVIAFEMAQQLLAHGESVVLLALIDTSLPTQPPSKSRRSGLRRLLQGASNRLDGWLLGERGAWGAHAKLWGADKLGSMRRRLGVRREAEVSVPEAVHRVIDANRAALCTYVPQAYEGRITQLLTRKTSGRTWEDARLAWSDLASHGLELHYIPGDHDSMLDEPNVGEVAAKLRSCLLRAAPEDHDAHGRWPQTEGTKPQCRCKFTEDRSCVPCP